MKLQYPLKVIGPLFVCLISIYSCNNNEIDSLERRVAELEAQLAVRDSVLLSDLEISSQESMNIMAGRGITNILGTLIIRNCVDLTPLAGLRSVEGLILEIPVGLTSLEGLNDLKGTNYLDLNFNGNSSVDMSALDGLETVNNINLGGTLPSVSWFNDITTLESVYVYTSTPTLVFSGFGSLTSANNVSLSNWEGSLDIQGFENLTSVMDLSMDANTLTVGGFNKVQSLNYLNINGNTLNFSGLNGITTLDYLFLGGHTVNISGLNGITSLNHLSLYGNTLNISGLENLESLQSLDVSAENSATGLNNLERVNDYLYLGIAKYDNFLTGLTTAGSMGLYSYYSYYPYTPATGDIKIFADFGFTSLQSIGGLALDIPSLESLEGFDFSNSTLQEFSVYNGPNLVDISALSTYSGSVGYLNLNNTSLSSLSGLENITGINDYLSITGNSQLEDWCAIKDIFDVLPATQRYVSGNLVNPASSEDIVGCE